jgi:tetratricopeptide (TPR) repeat protein
LQYFSSQLPPQLQQYEEAIFWYEKSLRTAEKLFGKQSKNYVNVLSNIASLQKDLANYAEAEKNMLEALEIQEKLWQKTRKLFIDSQ